MAFRNGRPLILNFVMPKAPLYAERAFDTVPRRMSRVDPRPCALLF